MSDPNEVDLPGPHDLMQVLRDSLIDGRFSALLLLDVDNFREINESRGFETGDEVLALVARRLESKGWQAYRVGGDEFAVILRDSGDLSEIESFRVTLAGHLEEATGVRATLSIGALPTPEEEPKRFGPEAAPLLYSTVHDLLFEAKSCGRDCLVCLSDETASSADQLRIAVQFYRTLSEVNGAAARKMAIESRTDVLTGLYNRRGFEDAFGRSVQASQRSGNPLALIYMDSDTLKRINDTRGHDGGDRFIVDLAGTLRSVVRGTDFLSRWAGDEFAVVMDNTTKEHALALARRILEAVAERTEGTMSIGLYCGVPGSAGEALKLADEALYRAKRAGKNRVELAAAGNVG